MPETFRPAFPGRPLPLISYGLPFAEAVRQHAVETFHASRVYVMASGTLARSTPHLGALKAVLGEGGEGAGEGRLAGVRVGMRPHTLWSEVLEVVADARACGADLLVTLGAGSLTDAAKVVSFALANGVASVAELEAVNPTGAGYDPATIRDARIPIVCVPTSLSGGEYSATGGATKDDTGRKWAFSGRGMPCPSLVVLDPSLCAGTTPPHIWLSTGIKAVDHCVETLCALKSDEDADADARRGLEKLVPGLLKCKRDGNDLDAFLQCQLGVIEAMSAAARGVMLGASHGIGHQLGPVGVGHGETSCILLPAVCKFNYERGANRERQEAIAKQLWQLPEAVEIFEKEGLKQEQGDLGDLIGAIVGTLGMPRTLREFGIGEDKLDSIAEHSLLDRWVKSNPAPLDKQGVLEILRMVLG